MFGIGVVTAPAIPNLVRDLTTGKPVIPAKKKAIISEAQGPIGAIGLFNASANAYLAEGVEYPVTDCRYLKTKYGWHQMDKL